MSAFIPGLDSSTHLRDIDLPWLSQIPTHWNLLPLKRLVETPITDGPHETPEFSDSGIPFVSAEAVYGGKVHFEAMRGFISRKSHEAYSRKYLPRRNDIYVVKSGATTGKVAIVDFDDEFNIWSPLAAIRCDLTRALPYFIFYAINSDYFQGQVQVSWSLGTQPNIGMEVLENLVVAIPPLAEQRVIADYLDCETARLDRLVAAKERVLELLAEKRRALITRAVTRGLDPRTSLHHSGIPWLGEIPAHWTATRMKFLATEPLAYGANEAALEDDSTFPRFVRITDVDSEGNLRHETFKSLPPKVAEPYLLRDGDVLLARSGATVGKTFIYKPAWGVAYFAGYLIRCRCNTILMQPDFLYAYTQTEPYWWQVREGTIQATIQNFSAEKYGDLVVTVPPLEEQKAIVTHIAAETAKLYALRAATERTIALLKERRAALIAAAVTGKINVRGEIA